MASEDADRSSSRLSSFSVYDDPPVTNPGLIQRQLELELQLKNCIEQLIKEYFDTDSLEKVEELTTHQLSCCGRISAHRLQLLRLKRTQPLEECDVEEEPVELPQELLYLLADDTVGMDSTLEIFSTNTNGMETEPTSHDSLQAAMDTSNHSNINLLMEDDRIDAELNELVEGVVNKAIKTAVAQLVEQNTTTCHDVHSSVAVEVEEKEVKANVENELTNSDHVNDKSTDILVPSSIDVHEENKKYVTEVDTTVKNESTSCYNTTEAQLTEMAAKTSDNGQIEEDVVAQYAAPNLEEVHTECEGFPNKPHTSTKSHVGVADVAKSITEESLATENTGTQSEHAKNEEPIDATKDIKTFEEPQGGTELPSDPTKELPAKCDENLPSSEIPSTTSPAKTIQPSDSCIVKDPIKDSSVPSDGKKLVKIDNTQIPPPPTSPAEPTQVSSTEFGSKKRVLAHAHSNPILDDEPVQKTKPANATKAQTLDFRSSPSMDQKKKLKTLGKSKPGLTVSANVTPLGAFSTFEWDPTCLLEELYIDCKPISPPGVQPSRLIVEMEKLPRNQVKKTIAKGWKKRYFCITAGNLYYYEDKKMAKALGVVKLNGAKVVCENSVIKVTDKLNQTIAIRGKPEDTYRMHRSLQLESVHPTLVSVISPYPGTNHPAIIVDIGSCSVRAGFAQGEAYPRLFFPAVCSVVKDTDEIQSCGLDALIPSARQNCEVVFPTRQKLRMDQETSVPIRYIHFFLLYIFKELQVEPSSAKVIMTLPQNYTEKDKELIMEMLLENLSCEAACLLDQSILSLYSYGATSGIVVDIGDRTDIVPIVDGYKIESGITKLKVGGAAVTESLRRLSTEYGLRYFSDVEFYITRLIKEKIGFVSQDFGTDLENCTANAANYKRALEVAQYQLPDRKTLIAMDSPLFRSLEGFFQPSLWGKDIPSIPECVLKAIQACDVDRRREMARSIFLSGGATLATGFQERLEQELTAISPSSYIIQVQASVSRHHAAFLGAAILASLDSFQDSWITKEDFARLKI